MVSKAISLVLYLSAVAPAQVHVESPIWSPDGKRIAFEMSVTGQGTDWNVYLANIDGTGFRQLTRTGAWDAAWSPDGANIAFVSTVAGKRQISTMSVDGSNVRQLTRGDGENFHPSWSPKGTRLAFTCRSGASSRICVMNADGSEVHAVTHDDQQCRWPAWSPDAKRIAYYSQGEVWTANLETEERVHLFTMGPAGSTLDWSPDGRQILFAGGTAGQAGIQVFDILTGGTRQILGADLRPGEPRWSSDGGRVLFVAAGSKSGIYCLDMSTSAIREIISGTKKVN